MGMLTMMQKVFNIDPTLLLMSKSACWINLLLITQDFQFGEIDGGTYTSGIPVTSPDDSELDCRSYSVPDIRQFWLIVAFTSTVKNDSPDLVGVLQLQVIAHSDSYR